MPVTVSYPGLYIEEIPSSAHSIIPAPTSIAVFVGYSHPFKTDSFNTPARLFSFGDFEREFGGIFQSGAIDTNLGYAVYQFFLNGGSDAYVIGLKPQYQLQGAGSAPIAAPIAPASATVATTGGGGITFTAREPTDIPGVTMINVKITNVRPGTGGAEDMADYTITYGTRVESYRDVANTDAGFSAVSRLSSLVSISPSGAGYTSFTSTTVPAVTLAALPPSNLIGSFSASDFTSVFHADRPLDKVDVFNLLLLPGVSDSGVLSAALAFAERKQAFVIMDPPPNAGADATFPPAIAGEQDSPMGSGVATIPLSQNGALYFPYLKSQSPLNGEPIELPPSGFVAGVYARTDTRRGVWKAPAGVEAIVSNTTGVVESGRMNEQRQGVLNLAGVNCLRSFPNVGTVVFGARTLVSANPAFQENMYVPVRRMTLFIEQTLLANLKWVVFEPNDEPLWVAIRMTIENFMLALFNQDALQGSKPSEAFMVKCDRTTTSVDDQNTGRVNIVVGFAALKPAEFVIIKISHLAGQTQT